LVSFWHTGLGQQDENLVIIQIFQPITILKSSHHCQAVLSLVDLFAEIVLWCAPGRWNARRRNVRTLKGNKMVQTLDNVMPGELCVTIWQFQKSSFFCPDIENAQYPDHQ
jgi:hypothetical protein